MNETARHHSHVSVRRVAILLVALWAVALGVPYTRRLAAQPIFVGLRQICPQEESSNESSSDGRLAAFVRVTSCGDVTTSEVVLRQNATGPFDPSAEEDVILAAHGRHAANLTWLTPRSLDVGYLGNAGRTLAQNQSDIYYEADEPILGVRVAIRLANP